MTAGTCVVTAGACVVTAGACVVTAGACVVTAGACVVTAGACVVTAGACVVTAGACVVTAGACVVTEGSFVVTASPVLGLFCVVGCVVPFAESVPCAVVPSGLPVSSGLGRTVICEPDAVSPVFDSGVVSPVSGRSRALQDDKKTARITKINANDLKNLIINITPLRGIYRPNREAEPLYFCSYFLLFLRARKRRTKPHPRKFQRECPQFCQEFSQARKPLPQ